MQGEGNSGNIHCLCKRLFIAYFPDNIDVAYITGHFDLRNTAYRNLVPAPPIYVHRRFLFYVIDGTGGIRKYETKNKSGQQRQQAP